LLQSSFLLWAALQEQQHAVHRRGIGDGTPIEFDAGEGMDVTTEGHELRFVNGLGDSSGDDSGLRGRYAIRLGLRGGAKCRERQSQSKKEEGIAKDQRLEFHVPSTL
jgi:hypothetical protein